MGKGGGEGGKYVWGGFATDQRIRNAHDLGNDPRWGLWSEPGGGGQGGRGSMNMCESGLVTELRGARTQIA